MGVEVKQRFVSRLFFKESPKPAFARACVPAFVLAAGLFRAGPLFLCGLLFQKDLSISAEAK